jgi:hypothetical protein
VPGAAKSPYYGKGSSQIHVTLAAPDIGAVHLVPACIAANLKMLASGLRSTCLLGGRRDGNDKTPLDNLRFWSMLPWQMNMLAH